MQPVYVDSALPLADDARPRLKHTPMARCSQVYLSAWTSRVGQDLVLAPLRPAMVSLSAVPDMPLRSLIEESWRAQERRSRES